MLQWPLMKNNIKREDIDVLIQYLSQDDPRLTNGNKVMEFEEKWSEWIGTKYSIFVNSGSSANLLTLLALKELYGCGEVIVPALTWASDIASVIQCGFLPVFVDIDPLTLGMDTSQVLKKITSKTKAVFLTHILGLNAINEDLLDVFENNPQIKLIEDVCESHGAKYKGKKLGTYGFASNFSFYYAHHMSSIEGGIICTENKLLSSTCRMLRSHGLIRESNDLDIKQKYQDQYPDLNPEFIFSYPAYNMRSTEINAVIALNQIKTLDNNIIKRNYNFNLFLDNLNSNLYKTQINTSGCSNYALILILQKPNDNIMKKIVSVLKDNCVEFRQGLSGGGNQLRQPYLINKLGQYNLLDYPEVEHIHKYSLYIGNYPDLEEWKIIKLCDMLNTIS